MKRVFHALCWAAAIIGVAAANWLGVIGDSSATTLLITLPVAGWLALGGNGCCVGRRAA